MIAWAVIWIFLLALLILFIFQENINGGKAWRFVLCCVIIFFIIFIPIIMVNEYWSSYTFYWSNINFATQANAGLTESQEYAILGRAINYNYQLYLYQSRCQKWGIFAPEYNKIKEMPLIQLTGFDMSKYRWWE